MAIQLHSSMAVHPGLWLKRNVVDHYGFTVTRVDEKLHVTRPAMSHLLNGKAALSPEMAIRFEMGSASQLTPCCACKPRLTLPMRAHMPTRSRLSV